MYRIVSATSSSPPMGVLALPNILPRSPLHYFRSQTVPTLAQRTFLFQFGYGASRAVSVLSPASEKISFPPTLTSTNQRPPNRKIHSVSFVNRPEKSLVRSLVPLTRHTSERPEAGVSRTSRSAYERECIYRRRDLAARCVLILARATRARRITTFPICARPFEKKLAPRRVSPTACAYPPRR